MAVGECPLVLAGSQDLWEFLASPVWPGTVEPRELGTCLLFTENGALKVLLNDKAQRLVAFSTLDMQESLLAQLDMLVTEPSVDWRMSKFNTKPR